MTEFLIELYVSKTNGSAPVALWVRLGAAAAAMTADGLPVRLMRSIFVPNDETCFVLLEAATAEHVHEAARRAEVVFDRIAEATVDLTEAQLHVPLASQEAGS